LYPTEVRGAGQGFCYNSGRAIGALFPALVGFLSDRLGLASAILLFSLLAYGIMLLALIMLPETKGRSVAAIEPGDMSSLPTSPVAVRDGLA
jgi:nitrate/nitrite transporter NarK